MYPGDLIRDAPRPLAGIHWFDIDTVGYLGVSYATPWQDMARCVVTKLHTQRGIDLIETMDRLDLVFSPWTALAYPVVEEIDANGANPWRLAFFFTREVDEVMFRLIW